MNRTAVRSSNICSIGYDAQESILEVEFRSGAVYQYSGVPEDAYQGFMHAASKGSYFRDYIKDRYPYRQVR